MRFVCLFKIRIDDDPAAMLADYELLVGSDVDKTLRSDGVEASTAGVSVIDGHDSEMIVDAGADAVVRAHRPRIDLAQSSLTERSFFSSLDVDSTIVASSSFFALRSSFLMAM